MAVADAGLRSAGAGNRRDWAPRSAAGRALLVVLVALALRAWDFGDPVIHVDEEYYLLVGDRMLKGAIPYLDIWDRKPLGLFLLYAGMRALPGDGIVAYQVVATLFAAGTAWLIERAARVAGAGRGPALAAGVGYLLWLPLLSGRGGQSPVFYDLFVAAGGLLTLRLPTLTEQRASVSVLLSGALACLLAGLAIAIKYTPVVEGAFFGLAHLYYARRAGAGWMALAAAALGWMALGALPSLLPVLWYWSLGPVAFKAFWFANFVSITLRPGFPAAKIAARLIGTWAQLAPLVVAVALAWRARPWSPPVRLATLWLAAALIAWASVGAFFDHYALPLLAPLLVIASTAWTRYPKLMAASLAAALLTLVVNAALRPAEAAPARALAAFVRAHSGRECPYVFTGDSATYLLADACVPTPYAFPSTLSYDHERGATGVDEAGEVRRIMARRPPVVVMLDPPLAPLNAGSLTAVRAALAAHYRPAFRVHARDGVAIAYLRVDPAPPQEPSR